MQLVTSYRHTATALATLVAMAGFAGSGAWHAPEATAQAAIFVNSTADPPNPREECAEDAATCTLRGALLFVQQQERGGIIRACFDPAEVPGAAPCPPGKKPLTKRDPGYDETLGKWVIKQRTERAFLLTENGTIMDFRQGLTWNSPADNRIILEPGLPNTEAAFQVVSENNVVAGIEFRGAFSVAAIYLPGGTFGEASANNQIGPGNIFAGITRGAGVKLSGEVTFGNRVFGNWCGITGDGSVRSAVHEDCIQLDQGTYGNVIGDRAVENRNVFAASELGSGVVVEGPETHDTEIRGNWFGMDFTGAQRIGLKSGIQLVYTPIDTRIIGNVISGNDNAGIALFDAIEDVLIEDNIIGADPDGERCIPNIGFGIALQGGPRGTRIVRNHILCNNAGGILAQGGGTQNNLFTENRITRNNGHAIDTIQGAHAGILLPVIDLATRTTVRGAACPSCRVEVFSDPDKEAAVYEGVVTAGSDGRFSFEKAAGFAHDNVTVTASNDVVTSALSAAVVVSGGPEPTTPTVETPATPTATAETPETPPTPTSATPSPTPCTGPECAPASTLYLPWTGSRASTGS